MKIEDKFNQLEKDNRIALILYLTFGYPSIAESVDLIKKFSELNVDIVEVGIPFSDPVADGKTIQYASEMALRNGASITRMFDEVCKINLQMPLVMMTYYNPVIAYGLNRIFTDMKEAGFDGIIIPDLPVEEINQIKKNYDTKGINFINLVTPVTDLLRIKLINENSTGFIYCVSLTGVTGARDQLNSEVFSFLQKLKKLVDKPVAVGFGISKKEHITQLKKYADGVIIGSKIIEAIRNNENIEDLIKQYQEAL
ncbi:MAG: tryptophan synthase subunit alpha [Candidatus Marinimicrobia bacterium]|nr:tryptophan synthase subunit alpha [Candidatus Neomarinimicrobiota bacterium]